MRYLDFSIPYHGKKGFRIELSRKYTRGNVCFSVRCSWRLESGRTCGETLFLYVPWPGRTVLLHRRIKGIHVLVSV